MSDRATVDSYIRRFAAEVGVPIAPLDDGGYTSVRRGTVTVGINVLEERGVLMILAPIMEVPAREREALYRRLLELNFLRTADAAFAIDGNIVYARALRALAGLDYEELRDILGTVADVADSWDGPLRAEFGD